MNGPDTRTPAEIRKEQDLADAHLREALDARPKPAPMNRDQRRRYAALSRRSQTR